MNIVKLNNVKAKNLIPGGEAKFVHSKNMTFAYWDIKANSILPEHAHPHEQALNLIEGVLELTVEGKKQIMESNSVAIIPPNAKHIGKTITDCTIIDVFYPKREDLG